MPILVSSTWCGMQVQNGVDSMLGTSVHQGVKSGEPFPVDSEKITFIIQKVTVIEWNSQAIETQRLEKFRILFCPEIFVKLVEKVLEFLRSHFGLHYLFVFGFMSGIARNEVLHIEMAAGSGPGQNGDEAVTIDNFCTFSFQESWHGKCKDAR
ncbi:hypothetical protein PGUG_00388 [Meyerozyma guilliermondii ATCC 6260]|uniref:Uncharacterized protein n=1 Tax=Meyerozyma guilliermondii (strain ATCC 6260 / CBS 566 / DSM 6381 / JCM 1539 / NBRC 10279 / NRRL Y-324) TaxID=294746 RepID=A5DAT3_PICGU|nr:uncharacterized protein PGUG_00388 [Meyerozyma guilliermondii ATCC 6260]EDK36291.2 hypothetical protein PGUG_00388 [Meyerozyma guilliermondii ATCC 6260]